MAGTTEDVPGMLDAVEARLRQWPVGAEHGYRASLWRELISLRGRLAVHDVDDGLVRAVNRLAGRVTAGPPSGSTVEPDALDLPPVPTASLIQLIDTAMLAPGLPGVGWRFTIGGGCIEVRVDRSDGSPYSDRAIRISCGAAVYTMRLAFPIELGRHPVTSLLPDPDDGTLLARLGAGHARPATSHERRLYRVIDRRRGGRRAVRPGTPMTPVDLSALVAAARAEGCDLNELTGTGRPAHSRWPGTHLAVLGSVGDSPADQLITGQALQRVLLTAAARGLEVSVSTPAVRASGTPHLLLDVEPTGASLPGRTRQAVPDQASA